MFSILKNALSQFMSFQKSVFSEGDQGSASRVLTAITVSVSCGCLIHVVMHTHAIPDALTMGGLAAFATAPYALNQAKNALSKQ